uniref:Uncharacterized protein n=1 Tax=Astyanax mexicanus TaxID=7994 RepID=A0A3B1K2M9_ASTMX
MTSSCILLICISFTYENNSFGLHCFACYSFYAIKLCPTTTCAQPCYHKEFYLQRKSSKSKCSNNFQVFFLCVSLSERNLATLILECSVVVQKNGPKSLKGERVFSCSAEKRTKESKRGESVQL